MIRGRERLQVKQGGIGVEDRARKISGGVLMSEWRRWGKDERKKISIHFLFCLKACLFLLISSFWFMVIQGLLLKKNTGMTENVYAEISVVCHAVCQVVNVFPTGSPTKFLSVISNQSIKPSSAFTDHVLMVFLVIY